MHMSFHSLLLRSSKEWSARIGSVCTQTERHSIRNAPRPSLFRWRTYVPWVIHDNLVVVAALLATAPLWRQRRRRRLLRPAGVRPARLRAAAPPPQGAAQRWEGRLKPQKRRTGCVGVRTDGYSRMRIWCLTGTSLHGEPSHCKLPYTHCGRNVTFWGAIAERR